LSQLECEPRCKRLLGQGYHPVDREYEDLLYSWSAKSPYSNRDAGKRKSMTYSVVTRERGQRNSSLPMQEQESWDAHARFMNALVDDGFVVLGGPLGDGLEALLIIAAESAEEIRSRLADDPWTPMDLLPTAKVERWEVLLG
jgi:uncharacterized protein YciI